MEQNEKNFKAEKTAKKPDLWEIKTLERFANFEHPKPIDKEVSWDKTRTIMSKTDQFGVIEYANDTFIDVSGYEEHELMGMPHSIVRHPDMPKVLFKVLWDNLKQGIVVKPIVKNLSKSGRYYWVIADFEIKRNEKGEITHYFSRRKSVAPEVVAKVEGLYRKLLQIEESAGMAASEKYLLGYLEDIGKSYNELIEDLVLQYTPGLKDAQIAAQKQQLAVAQAAAPQEEEEERKGFFARFFGRR